MTWLNAAHFLEDQDMRHCNFGLTSTPSSEGVSGAVNAFCRAAPVQIGCRSNPSRLHRRFQSDRERFALLDGGAVVPTHCAARNLGQT